VNPTVLNKPSTAPEAFSACTCTYASGPGVAKGGGGGVFDGGNTSQYLNSTIASNSTDEPAAVGTPDTDGARAACEALKDRGFLTAPAGALHNQVKIRPPLVFDHAQADLFLEAFADVAAEEGVR